MLVMPVVFELKLRRYMVGSGYLNQLLVVVKVIDLLQGCFLKLKPL